MEMADRLFWGDVVSINARSSDIDGMAGYTAAQIEAVTEALELTSQAVEGMIQAHLPLSMSAVQETESHLFRAQACLAAILSGAGKLSKSSGAS